MKRQISKLTSYEKNNINSISLIKKRSGPLINNKDT